jgi:hypothetical protein
MKPIDSFEEAIAFALTLPGTELGTSYGQLTVKISANGRGFVFPGHERDTSFGLMLDHGLVDILTEVSPETFWQSPHYIGSAALLVRFDSPSPEAVRDAIVRSSEIAAALKPARPRSPRKR